MNKFKVVEIINADTIRVTPDWQYKMKDGSVITGSRIKIRGLDVTEGNKEVIGRLGKLLLGDNKEIALSAPELVNTDNHNDAIVSCSVYVAKSNITYYFPEYAYKDSE